MIHIRIAQERRKEPRELAIVLQDQLHTMGLSITDLSSPQIVYAAEWDQVSPWITVLKGDRADLKLGYMGWPTVTRDEWEAQVKLL
jgi:hypothetical protein